MVKVFKKEMGGHILYEGGDINPAIERERSKSKIIIKNSLWIKEKSDKVVQEDTQSV